MGDETECDLELSLSDDEYFSERKRKSIKKKFDCNKAANEAIYAVVNLEDKHARRAKLKEIEEKKRPKSCHITLSGDYEEV